VQPKTLGQAVAYYLERFENPHTRRAYAQVLEPFAQDFGACRKLQSISAEDIDTWENQLHAKNLALATVATRKKTLKVFFNWCVKREWIDKSPARFLKVKKRRVSLASKALSRDVRDQMLESVRHKREHLASVRDTAILALITTYGARAVDVAQLTLSNVNLVEEWIVFRMKGEQENKQPLPPETSELLAEWLDIRNRLCPDPPHNFVFTTIRTSDGNRYQQLKSSSIQTMFKRLAKKVSGTMRGPHSARHLRGQELMDQGVPPTLVRDILGHSDVRITLEYYSNQDWERAKQILTATEMGRRMDEGSNSTPAPRRRAKIVHVDFRQRSG